MQRKRACLGSTRLVISSIDRPERAIGSALVPLRLYSVDCFERRRGWHNLGPFEFCLEPKRAFIGLTDLKQKAVFNRLSLPANES